MKPYYNRAIELYNSGITSKSDIARKIILENLTGDPFVNVRKMVSIYLNHKVLSATCDEAGIPVEKVKHYWHKGKHMSINVDNRDPIKTYEEMRDDIIDQMQKHSPSYPEIKRDSKPNGHLLVIDPADIHIGKLASSYETGESYNSEIALQRVYEGIEGILSKASGFNIDKILFVAGNDILHIDNPKRTTTSGTPQDTDGMWYENFFKAKNLYVDVIERLLSVAPVHFVFNPSNHDYTNGFFLADVISSWFRLCSDVTFDCSLSHRKYFKYYNNLIGTTHGDGAKANDLPILMAQESPIFWANSKHRYVYTHHVHHKTSKDFIGVTVESLRSPSSADSWHHRNGYQHAPKAIEGFIHCRNNGQVARLTHIF
jgi:hypothetical protein